ncbi:unnamed protein product [Prorocentrum cordatum]|uniref:Uncharacterized protein n=1 Tax=Prorocentrum cordatum TaxID=2364126 RepID=A0ABN9V5U8_9DINO|nr:unnamed protein product [Polarella glacialis]
MPWCIVFSGCWTSVEGLEEALFPSKSRSKNAVGQNNGAQHCRCSAKEFDWVCNSAQATTLRPSAHADTAGNGNPRCQCSVRCGRRRWSPTQLQRRDQRVREGRAMAAGPRAAERDAGGEAGALYTTISYSAGISACGKGEQWQRALALLSEMREAKLQPNSATMLGLARAGKANSGSRRWRY